MITGKSLLNMKKILFFFLAASFIFLYSCSDNNNDDPSDPNPPAPTTQIMNINVNGVDHVITEFDNTLVVYPVGSIMGHRMDLRFYLDTVLTDIVIGNYDFQAPPPEGIVEKIYDTNVETGSGPNTECEDTSAGYVCDEAGCFYDFGLYMYYTWEDEDSGFNVTITENNPITHKVSGSFDFKLSHWAQTDTLHCVGTFENLEYTVYN